MAKAPPPSNRTKERPKDTPSSGVREEIRTPHKGGVAREGKRLAPQAEKAAVSRILRDIQQNARDLSAGADRLLKRVS